MNNLKTRLIIALVLLLTGTFVVSTVINRNPASLIPPKEEQITSSDSKVAPSKVLGRNFQTTIRYEGKEEVDAFTLLEENANIKFETYDFGKLVTEINGVKNTKNKFWLFYINDEMAQTSADNYITKDGDILEWRYEDIN